MSGSRHPRSPRVAIGPLVALVSHYSADTPPWLLAPHRRFSLTPLGLMFRRHTSHEASSSPCTWTCPPPNLPTAGKSLPLAPESLPQVQEGADASTTHGPTAFPDRRPSNDLNASAMAPERRATLNKCFAPAPSERGLGARVLPPFCDILQPMRSPCQPPSTPAFAYSQNLLAPLLAHPVVTFTRTARGDDC